MTSRVGAVLAPRRRNWVLAACVLGVVVITAVANLAWITSPYYGRAESAPHGSPVAVDQGVQVGTVPTRHTPTKPGSTPAARGNVVRLAPNRLEIPALDARAPIVSVATSPDGELEVPEDPKIVGWWSPGAKPGAKVGTAVFAGHVNFAGVSGTLAEIGRLQPGDVVKVFGRHNGRATVVRFTVTGVRTYHKTRLPYQQIFDQKSIGRLAIITCGGPFDASTGNYLDNIVAYAVPA